MLKWFSCYTKAAAVAICRCCAQLPQLWPVSDRAAPNLGHDFPPFEANHETFRASAPWVSCTERYGHRPGWRYRVGVPQPARLGPAMGLLDVHGRQPQPRGHHGRPGIDETRGHRRRDFHGNQHRRAAGAGRFHEPQVAGTFRPCRPRGRSAGPAIRRRYRAGMVRHRRPLGQAGAIDAAPGGQRDDRARSRALRRAACPARNRGRRSSASARSRRNWPRPGGSTMPMLPVLAFPTPQGKARVADIDEKALYYRAPFSSAPGVKPFLPEPDATTRLPADQCIAMPRIVDLTSRPDRRRPPGMGRAGGRLDDPPLRPHEHRPDARGRRRCRAWASRPTSSTLPPSTPISRHSPPSCSKPSGRDPSPAPG